MVPRAYQIKLAGYAPDVVDTTLAPGIYEKLLRSVWRIFTAACTVLDGVEPFQAWMQFMRHVDVHSAEEAAVKHYTFRLKVK